MSYWIRFITVLATSGSRHSHSTQVATAARIELLTQVAELTHRQEAVALWRARGRRRRGGRVERRGGAAHERIRGAPAATAAAAATTAA